MLSGDHCNAGDGEEGRNAPKASGRWQIDPRHFYVLVAQMPPGNG
jgi:hypothetical protein